jgi:hypothetical protein
MPKNEAATGHGKEFSAGLIFLCFVSFYQEKEMKRPKKALQTKSKIFTSLIF